MCGIFGIYNPNGLEIGGASNFTSRMSEQLARRGPDDQGEWFDEQGGIFLGQRRLSINDLTPAGRQPLRSNSGRYVITANGEIYNFLELRAEFKKNGYVFHGCSDTEVALAAIELHGFEGGLNRLVGMYAIGLWDRKDRVLYLARDRLGEKPLYYGQIGSYFAFASDLNALRQIPGWENEIDRDAIGLLMQHFYVPAPQTIYRGIKKMLPGCWTKVNSNNFCSTPPVSKYWSASNLVQPENIRFNATSKRQAIDDLDSLLRKSIKGKLISDVPLGAFLSGGIDSSTIVALMQAESMSRVKTFSIGFSSTDFDEANEARKVAQHLGTDHTELYVGPEDAIKVISDLPDIYSEPFADSSQIPTYLVSSLARENVTVALTGDGGDELFGGYNRYMLLASIWKLLGVMPQSVRHRLGSGIQSLASSHVGKVLPALAQGAPRTWRHRRFSDKMRKLGALCKSDSALAAYRTLISVWPRPSCLVEGAKDRDILQAIPSAIMNSKNLRQKMMLVDMMTYLPDDILVKVDRASMYESLEVRAPFLDHRIVEYAAALPLDLKISGREGKWILKEVLYKYVPKPLVNRPKMGFGVPIGHWLRGRLRPWAEELIDKKHMEEQGYFNVLEVQSKWKEHLESNVDWSAHLWPILMFQSWLERYERQN